MESILITQEMVGKIAHASYDMDNSIDLEILSKEDLDITTQWRLQLISQEEYNFYIEEERKRQAKHYIEQAKKWSKIYPDLV